MQNSASDSKVTTCSVSGLPVVELEEFKNVKLNDNYSVNLKKIGDSIIYASNVGDSKYANIKAYYGLVEAFIRKTDTVLPFIEIRDYSGLKGRPTRLQKKNQKDYLIKNQRNFLALISVNIPSWLEVTILTALKVYKTRMAFLFCKNYNEAVKSAVRIINNNSELIKFRDRIRFEDITIKPEWSYKDNSIEYLNGVIPGKLFYSKIIGSPNPASINSVVAKIDMVFSESDFSNKKYIRIADYSECKRVMVNARNLYVQGLKSINKKYNSSPQVTIIVGAKGLVRSMILLYTLLFKQEFIFVKNLNKAIEAINATYIKDGNSHTVQVRTSHIDEIIALSGSMIWGDVESFTTSVSEDNPLYPLASTLLLIQDDLADLRKAEIEHKNQLRSSLDEQQKLTRKLQERNNQANKLNQELSQKNETLRIQKDQLELTLIKLHSAQSQLIESDKLASLGMLTAGIAHEIGNPLNGIKVGNDLLLEFVKNDLKAENKEELYPILDIIDKGITNISNIVGSLNRFNRKNDDLNENCNIHLILNDCLVILENRLKYKVKISISFTPENVIVKGNEGRLHQVFLNILNNAEQAINTKDGKIDITTQTDDSNVIIEIKDNGHGIKSENLEKIKEPFFTTKEPGMGTGLGLSIVSGILEEHNGTMKYYSELDEGTTVKITLPLKK